MLKLNIKARLVAMSCKNHDQLPSEVLKSISQSNTSSRKHAGSKNIIFWGNAVKCNKSIHAYIASKSDEAVEHIPIVSVTKRCLLSSYK